MYKPKKDRGGQIESVGTWFYRALLMGRILEHLGYSIHNILSGDKEVLAGYLKREPDEIIQCLQMRGDQEDDMDAEFWHGLFSA